MPCNSMTCMAKPKHITFMKRYYLYLIVFLVSICNTVFSQTPVPVTTAPVTTPATVTPAAGAPTTTPTVAAPVTTPAAVNNGALITLNFNNGTPSLDKHFPFDKLFTLRLTNIPAAVDKIEIRLQTDPVAIADYKSKKARTDDGPADIILKTWNRGDATDLVIASYLKYNTDILVKITTFATRPITEDQKPALRNALAGDPDIGAIVAKMGKVSATDAPSVLVDYKAEIIGVLKKSLQKINPNYSFKEPDAIPVIQILRDFRQGIFNVEEPIKDFETFTQQSDTKKASLRKAFNELNWGSLQVSSPQYQAFKEIIVSLKAEEPAGDANTAVKNSLDVMANAFDPTITKRNDLIKGLIDRVILTDSYEASAVNTTYDPNFVNSAASYITLDIGIPYVARVDRVIMYSGINIYFRPIDKSIPLEHYKKWDRIWSSTSFLLGVSLASIEKEGQRKGLIGTNALVVGFGYRVLPFLKLTVGTFCHYRYDNNPVIDLGRYHFSTSPFIGLSIDADVKQLFSAFGTPFQ